MGRRRQSAVEDFLSLVVKAPWPLGVGLAILSFLVLNQIAQGEQVQVTSPDEMSRMLFTNLGITLAGVGQYLLPGLFLFGALGSFLGRRKKRKILQFAKSEPTHGIAALNWSQFEELVAELFRYRGFSVSHSGKAGPDGGVDIELKRGGESFLVQCKHWRARKVPVMTVRELYGAMTAAQAAGGFVVTSGEFTADAREFASGRNIELVDGAMLARFLTSHGQISMVEAEVAKPIIRKAPECPKCGASMVQRVARRGAMYGKKFWGCQSFPECRGTRPLDEELGP